MTVADEPSKRLEVKEMEREKKKKWGNAEDIPTSLKNDPKPANKGLGATRELI